MIAVVLSWALLLVVFFAFGSIAIACWKRIAGCEGVYTPVDRIWVGICAVGTMVLYVSVFLPLDIWVLVAVIAMALVYGVKNRQSMANSIDELKKYIASFPLWGKLVFVLITSTLLVYSLSTPLIYDEGLYHLQSMQWSEKAKAVVGLGNLHGRLGFNSSFLLLSTVFNYHPDSYFTFFTLNSFALLVFSFWLISLIFKTGNTPQSIAALVLVLLTSLFSLGVNASSTSTDILPNIFILYILINWALDSDFVKKRVFVLVAMAIFCITLKLSSAVILLAMLVCLVTLLKEKKRKTVLLILALGLIVAVPWLLRFYLLTGYLVYPFPAIDLFSADWKIPIALVTEEKDAAYAWARVPYVNAKEVLAMSMREWVPLWLGQLSLYNVLLYALAIASPLFLLMAKTHRALLAWAIALVGVLFGLFTAPDFRFGFGFLLSAIAIPFLMMDGQKRPMTQTITKGVLAVALVALLCIACSLLSTYQHLSPNSAISLLWKPQPVTLLGADQKYIKHRINNTTIFVPQPTNQCFDRPIPCVPYYNSNLEMRGKDIKDGFRIKK